MITVYAIGVNLDNAIRRSLAGNWSTSRETAEKLLIWFGQEARIYEVQVNLEIVHIQVMT